MECRGLNPCKGSTEARQQSRPGHCARVTIRESSNRTPCVLNLIHQLQPATLVNNRIGVPGDIATREQFIPDRVPTKSSANKLQGPSETPESTPASVPALGDFQLWETCQTIIDTWAYNKSDQQFKSVKEVIRELADVAGKGGNFLLNLGPTPEGTIQPEFVERLRAIGKRMKVNADSSLAALPAAGKAAEKCSDPGL
jgi:alpha-L-fucosidase